MNRRMWGTFALLFKKVMFPPSGKQMPVFLAVAGIMLGVITLIVVLSVMNGFQLSFIETIIGIGTYHMQLEAQQDVPSKDITGELSAYPMVEEVVPFAEYQVLISGAFNSLQGVALRGLDWDYAEEDEEFLLQLGIVEGRQPHNRGDVPEVLIGYEMAQYLGIMVGDNLELVTLGGGIRTVSTSFRVSGLFQSRYSEYNRGLCFTSVDALRTLSGSNITLKYGIRLRNRGLTRSFYHIIAPINKYKAVTWEEQNKAFFSALALEKRAMSLLIGLIFLIVAMNIHMSMRRQIKDRIEDIAILRSFGTTPSLIIGVYTCKGGVIGLAGGFLGLLLGMPLAYNINYVMDFLYQVVVPLFQGGGAVFFSMGFLENVPVRVLFQDVFLVFAVAVISSLWSALHAAVKATRVKPAVIFRREAG